MRQRESRFEPAGWILRLLSMSFIRWILAANLIAWPLLYLFLERWLRQFAYTVSVSAWSFVLSAGLALLLAWFSVLVQTWRTVRTDPAKVLRTE